MECPGRGRGLGIDDAGLRGLLFWENQIGSHAMEPTSAIVSSERAKRLGTPHSHPQNRSKL